MNATKSVLFYNGCSDYTGVEAAPFFIRRGRQPRTISLLAAGSNWATVFRLFMNNGYDWQNPRNNALFIEIGLPATQQSGVEIRFPWDVPFPTDGWRLLGALATTVRSGWLVRVEYL